VTVNVCLELGKWW